MHVVGGEGDGLDKAESLLVFERLLLRSFLKIKCLLKKTVRNASVVIDNRSGQHRR